MSDTSNIRIRTTIPERVTLKTGARLAGMPVSTWLRVLGLNEAKRLMRESQKALEGEGK